MVFRALVGLNLLLTLIATFLNAAAARDYRVIVPTAMFLALCSLVGWVLLAWKMKPVGRIVALLFALWALQVGFVAARRTLFIYEVL
jgi:hypothetical protein